MELAEIDQTEQAVTHPQRTCIEICTGPDCSAGGAALLEIEELIQEDSNNGATTRRFEILRGGCRDICSMGPNVHCRSEHFSRVRCPEDCLDTALQLGMVLPNDGMHRDETPSRVGLMMLKKADRSRWLLLRDIGRHTSKKSGSKISRQKRQSWERDLQQNHISELSAARMLGNTSQRTERATRRLDRLQRIVASRIANQEATLERGKTTVTT